MTHPLAGLGRVTLGRVTVARFSKMTAAIFWSTRKAKHYKCSKFWVDRGVDPKVRSYLHIDPILSTASKVWPHLHIDPILSTPLPGPGSRTSKWEIH